MAAVFGEPSYWMDPDLSEDVLNTAIWIVNNRKDHRG